METCKALQTLPARRSLTQWRSDLVAAASLPPAHLKNSGGKCRWTLFGCAQACRLAYPRWLRAVCQSLGLATTEVSFPGELTSWWLTGILEVCSSSLESFESACPLHALSEKHPREWVYGRMGRPRWGHGEYSRQALGVSTRPWQEKKALKFAFATSNCVPCLELKTFWMFHPEGNLSQHELNIDFSTFVISRASWSDYFELPRSLRGRPYI